MAQLQRLQEIDPHRFKAIMSSLSSALVSGSTTISRATKDAGVASQTDEASPTATRTWRWPVATFGGVALVGVAMLMLLRPEHHGELRFAADTGSVASGQTTIAAIAAGRDEARKTIEPSAPIAISGKTNADPSFALSPAAGALFATKPPRAASTSQPAETAKRVQQRARRTTSSPAIKKWSSDERWLAH
jgi:hypothetical protein